MSDLISRQAAIDAINSLEYPSSLVDVKRCLMDLPSADVPVRNVGEWIVDDDCEKFIAHCSNCENIIDSRWDFDFCPHCGSDNRGIENE